MASFNALSATMSAYLGHFTRIHNAINTLDTSSDEVTLASSSLKLEDYYNKLLCTHSSILEFELEGDELTSQLDKMLEASDKYHFMKAKLNSLIKVTPPVDPPPSPSASTSSTSTNPFNDLPKQNLPHFSGGALQWRPFWDRFNASIHSRDIPNVRKFDYLLQCLKGEPLEAVKALPCTDKNYDSAIDILKKRYGDPALLIGLYAEKIVSLQPVKDGDIHGYRALLDEFKAHIDQIEHLYEEVNHDGVHIPKHELFLSALLTRRLPEQSRIEWKKKTALAPLTRFDLTSLLNFASSDLVSRDSECLELTEEKPKSSEPKPRPPRTATSAFLARSQCPFCSASPHSAFACSKFLGLSIKERNELVRSTKSCFNCLNNHLASACPSPKTCAKCGKKHHTLLHLPNSPADSKSSDTPPHQSAIHASSNLTTSVSSIQKNRSILQTASVRLDGCNRYVRVLFDSGAERSYVSQRLVNELNPKKLGDITLKLETFGGHIGSPKKVSIYEFILFPRSPTPSGFILKLIALPKLCHPTYAGSPSVISELLADIHPSLLADPPTCTPKDIDIVLGIDALPHLLLPEPPEKRGRLLLQKSVFGIIIGGTVADDHPSSIVALSKVLRAGHYEHVSSLWDLESIGIKTEDVVQKQLKVHPVKKDDRYEVSLPWLDERRPSLSFTQANQRLSSFHRFPPEKKAEYIKVFNEYHDLHILEPANPHSGNFIPHHGVFQKNKLRIVYDASAKPWNGPSLNDCLSSGPNLLSNLLQILLRFRRYKYPLTSDIEIFLCFTCLVQFKNYTLSLDFMILFILLLINFL